MSDGWVGLPQYAVFVTHSVVGEWFESFFDYDDAKRYYEDMAKTPDQTAMLLKILDNSSGVEI